MIVYLRFVYIFHTNLGVSMKCAVIYSSKTVILTDPSDIHSYLIIYEIKLDHYPLICSQFFIA